MGNTRNKYIDILRVFALTYIVLYNIYIVSGMKFKYNIINSILSYGGEIGVSIFFVISGFGIYKLLEKKSKDFSYKKYLSDRLNRIGPHYYISLIIIILFTSSAVYIGQTFLLNIISHVFLFHNLFYDCHSAINGVLWAIGVIFQFYLIAPFLKKAIDEHPIITTLTSIFISLFIKYILFIYIFPMNNCDEMYYFIYGRQLFTTLDAFTLGMLVSKYSESRISNKNWIIVIFAVILILFMTLLGACYLPILNYATTYSPTKKAVFYFVVLECVIAILIYGLSNCKYRETRLNNILLFFAKHEYAIYIWHLLIINSLVNYSTLYKDIMDNSYIKTYIVLFVLVVVISLIFDLVISNINFKEVFNRIKNIFNFIKKYLYYFVILIIVICSVKMIPSIVELIKNYNFTTNACDGACIIYNNVKDKIKCNKIQCKYIYVDTEDTGYLYFYQLRYYLSPNISEHYNKYVYNINAGSDEEFINLFVSSDADFVLVNKNERMEKNGYKLAPEEGKVFTINRSSKTISSLFKEVK